MELQILLRGPKNAREAVKHFGPAPGVPHSHIGCMCAQREGSMRGLEEEGTVRDLGYKMALGFTGSCLFVYVYFMLLDCLITDLRINPSYVTKWSVFKHFN